ncbi:MAG: L-ribulose-5-phosphate 4-epimerase AraD [Spirochaetes bacterium]|nr:L-ribulose-5-phosphate 4-epimerase AraD [Spirochaetota bacterium]
MDVYKTLKEEAFEANMEISRRNLAIYTWGNASAFDAAKGVFAIKPSGLPYDRLEPGSMVLVDLEGRVLEGALVPSSDTKTHLVLYREFKGLGGVTHTHSTYATAWAQAARPVPLFGTTHADHCASEVPCTPFISAASLGNDYELETGLLITDTFMAGGLNPVFVNMVLVAGHGPFTWGDSAAKSVYNGAVLEEVCKMAYLTLALNPQAAPLPGYITEKHWERKHGKDAYYGQRGHT